MSCKYLHAGGFRGTHRPHPNGRILASSKQDITLGMPLQTSNVRRWSIEGVQQSCFLSVPDLEREEGMSEFRIILSAKRTLSLMGATAYLYKRIHTARSQKVPGEIKFSSNNCVFMTLKYRNLLASSRVP